VTFQRGPRDGRHGLGHPQRAETFRKPTIRDLNAVPGMVVMDSGILPDSSKVSKIDDDTFVEEFDSSSSSDKVVDVVSEVDSPPASVVEEGSLVAGSSILSSTGQEDSSKNLRIQLPSSVTESRGNQDGGGKSNTPIDLDFDYADDGDIDVVIDDDEEADTIKPEIEIDDFDADFESD
jgi:hypothetical protein